MHSAITAFSSSAHCKQRYSLFFPRKILVGSAILLLAVRPVPYKGSDSPGLARLCIDPGYAPIYCQFFAILSHVKSLPHTNYTPFSLKRLKSQIRHLRIEVTSPVLPFYLGLGYLPGTEYLLGQ